MIWKSKLKQRSNKLLKSRKLAKAFRSWNLGLITFFIVQCGRWSCCRYNFLLIAQSNFFSCLQSLQFYPLQELHERQPAYRRLCPLHARDDRGGLHIPGRAQAERTAAEKPILVRGPRRGGGRHQRLLLQDDSALQQEKGKFPWSVVRWGGSSPGTIFFSNSYVICCVVHCPSNIFFYDFLLRNTWFLCIFWYSLILILFKVPVKWSPSPSTGTRPGGWEPLS